MIDRLYELKQRFGNLRPGLKPLTVVKIAIPVTTVRVTVNAQKRKELPLLDEIILRSIKSEIRSPGEIAALTGLDLRLVSNHVAELIVGGHATYSGKGELYLTPQGSTLAEEHAIQTPVVESMDIAFDRFIWNLAPYKQSQLLSKRQAREKGLLIAKARQSKRIDGDDIGVATLRQTLQPGRGENYSMDFLRIIDIRSRASNYYECEAVIFTDLVLGNVEIALLIDDKQSPKHDLAFISAGGISSFGLEIAPQSSTGPESENSSLSDNRLIGLEYAAHLYNSIDQCKNSVTLIVDGILDSESQFLFLTLLKIRAEEHVNIRLIIRDVESIRLARKEIRVILGELSRFDCFSILTINSDGPVNNTLTIDGVLTPWIPSGIDFHPASTAKIDGILFSVESREDIVQPYLKELAAHVVPFIGRIDSSIHAEASSE